MGVLLEQMGVRWVRLEFHIDHSDAYSLTHVSLNDYFINEVAPRHNFKILGLLGFQLVRERAPMELGNPATYADRVYGDGINTYMRTWLDRARMIVSRYHGRIAAYEVLNEPNLIGYHDGSFLEPEMVARLQARFYRFFHHIDRQSREDQFWRDHIQIILGALQPASQSGQHALHYRSDRDYLRAIYDSDDFQQYYATYGHFPLDGLGYHPYPKEIFVSLATPVPDLGSAMTPQPSPEHTDPMMEHLLAPTPLPQITDLELMNQRLDELRGVLHEVGDPQQPFWITEIGYNAGYPHHTDVLQAEFLRTAFTRLAHRADVAAIFWFKYEDFPPASGPRSQQWGCVRIPFIEHGSCPGGACYDVYGRPEQLRPAFWTYRELAGKASISPEPPSYVTITGPLTGTVGMPSLFTATTARESTTLPVTYHWQTSHQASMINESGLQDTVMLTWDRPGVQHVQLEIKNAAGTIISTYPITITHAP